MAVDYVILTPPDDKTPLRTILTSGGEPVALQVPHKWAERIVIALKLLDAHERDSRIGAYIEKIKEEMGKE
jgi:hypothetical protein